MWGAGAAAVAALWWVHLATTRVPCGLDGTFCSPGACHRLRSHLTHHLHGRGALTPGGCSLPYVLLGLSLPGDVRRGYTFHTVIYSQNDVLR
jgi:hypothetical protein